MSSPVMLNIYFTALIQLDCTHSLAWVHMCLRACCSAGVEGLCEALAHREASAVHRVRFGRHRYLIPLGDRNTYSREQVGVMLTCPVLGGQGCRVSGNLWVSNRVHSCSSRPAPLIKHETAFLDGFSFWSLLATASLRIQVW